MKPVGQAPNRFVRAINLVFFAVGVAALVWMAQRLGMRSIAAMLASVGWFALPLMLLSVTTLMLNTAAIRVFMRPEQRMIRYWRVFVAQLSGQSVNSVTPTGTVGEVLKITMLMGHAPRYRAVSSIIAFNVSVIFTNACLMLLAILLSLVFGEFPSRLNWILGITFAVLLTSILIVQYLLRNGFVFTLTRFAKALHLVSAERRDRIHKKLKAFDDQLVMFGPNREASYGAGFAYVAVARIVGWFDLWLVLYALNLRPGFVSVVIIAAMGTVIDSIASVVPLGIGAKEGGHAGLYELMGIGAMAGLSASLVSRIRVLAIAASGLLILLAVQAFDNIMLARSRRRLLERNRHRRKAP
jgi:uncharacterized protein (TIRG00374 family)